MTQLSAICTALIGGESLSIMSAFSKFGCSNLPREISRSIEKRFGATVTKTKKDFTSQYGQSGYYYEYSLRDNKDNRVAIKKMRKYIVESK